MLERLIYKHCQLQKKRTGLGQDMKYAALACDSEKKDEGENEPRFSRVLVPRVTCALLLKEIITSGGKKGKQSFSFYLKG